MTIAGSKGLIVDFSMEDQRALFKRREKIEKWRTLANEKKEVAKKERREERREEKRKLDGGQSGGPPTAQPLDLGAFWQNKQTHDETQQQKDLDDKKKREKKAKNPEKQLSRGQRQRLQRREAAKKAKAGDDSGIFVHKTAFSNPNAGAKATEEKEPAAPAMTAKEKIQEIMKKREQKA